MPRALLAPAVLALVLGTGAAAEAATPICDGRSATRVGTSGNDVIRGTSAADVIVGKGGADTIYGFGGNDRICGGDGADRIFGDAGTDRLFGGNHNDKIDGGSGNDYVVGAYGDDRLDGGSGNDVVRGDVGNDIVDGGDGADTINGGTGSDRAGGGGGGDTINGSDGNDTLDGDGRAARPISRAPDSGLARVDTGIPGSDRILGGAGNDTVLGGGGDDDLRGDQGYDLIWGGDGNDSVDGGTEADICFGGAGTDELHGGGGDDELWGEAGNDQMWGDLGNDSMYPGEDDDQFLTGDGSDHVFWGSGTDQCLDCGSSEDMHPAPPIIHYPTDGSSIAGPDVHIFGTAQGSTTVTLFEDGSAVAQGAADPEGNWSAVLQFAPGDHAVTANATDPSTGASVTSAAVRFAVSSAGSDTTPPPAPVIVDPPSSQTCLRSPVIVGGSAEPGSFVGVFEFQQQVASVSTDGSGRWAVGVSFAGGAHTIQAQAADAAGNASPASNQVSFCVESTAPAAPTIQFPQSGYTYCGNTISVEGTAEPNLEIQVFWGEQAVARTASDQSGFFRVLMYFPDGSYVIRAHAVDGTSTYSAGSNEVSFSVTSYCY